MRQAFPGHAGQGFIRQTNVSVFKIIQTITSDSEQDLSDGPRP